MRWREVPGACAWPTVRRIADGVQSAMCGRRRTFAAFRAHFQRCPPDCGSASGLALNTNRHHTAFVSGEHSRRCGALLLQALLPASSSDPHALSAPCCIGWSPPPLLPTPLSSASAESLRSGSDSTTNALPTVSAAKPAYDQASVHADHPTASDSEPSPCLPHIRPATPQRARHGHHTWQRPRPKDDGKHGAHTRLHQHR